jgi:hypothetical protein
VDVIVYVVVSVFSLILVLFTFMGRRVTWSLFAFFGAIIEGYNALALLSDGNLTSGTTPLASANGNLVSDFTSISLIPIILCASAGIIAIRRAFDM